MANGDSRIENLKGSWEYVSFVFVLLNRKIMNWIEFKVSGEHFEAILKELGINKVLRALAKTMKPHLIISEANGRWSFKSETTFKTTAYDFTPGVQFDDVGHDGDTYQVRWKDFVTFFCLLNKFF